MFVSRSRHQPPAAATAVENAVVDVNGGRTSNSLQFCTSSQRPVTENHAGRQTLLADWNSMMTELFTTADGRMVDHTQDSSSGIASDDPCPTSPGTVSDRSSTACKFSPTRRRLDLDDERQEPLPQRLPQAGWNGFDGSIRQRGAPVRTTPDGHVTPRQQQQQQQQHQQQSLCYRYRYSDMTRCCSRDVTPSSSVPAAAHAATRPDDVASRLSPAVGISGSGRSGVRGIQRTTNSDEQTENRVARQHNQPQQQPFVKQLRHDDVTDPVYRQNITPRDTRPPQYPFHPQQQQLQGQGGTPTSVTTTRADIHCRQTSSNRSVEQPSRTTVRSSSVPLHRRASPLSLLSRASPLTTASNRSDDWQHQPAVKSVSVQQPSATAYQSLSVRTRTNPSFPLPRGTSSPISVLSDVLLTRIFNSGLRSDDLVRCSIVSRRWNALVWNPLLWTSVDLTQAVDIDADEAVKSLTRILSRDTPCVCVTVERVLLNGCERLTDRGLYAVARRCTELRRLELVGCRRLTNVALFEVVSRCVSLTHLDVTCCEQISCISLTPEANMAAVTYGHQVYLRYLDMSECSRLDDAGLQLVATYCPALVQLYIRRCPLVTDVGVQYLAAFCSALRELSVAECRQLTDFGLGELAVRRSTGLRYLSAARCEALTDRTLRALAGHCSRLRYLNVRGCAAISDAGVCALVGGCRRLRSLDVGECEEVGDASLRALGAACPALRRLSVRGCTEITEAGVTTLARLCADLRQLNVQDCPRVGPAGLEMVRKYCRHCAIEHNNMAFY